MNRRSFLRGAAGTAGAVGVPGCSTRTRVLERVERPSLSIPVGEYHRTGVDLTGDEREQFDLRYGVTAEGRFDVLLFGGKGTPGNVTDPPSIDDRAEERIPTPSGRHSVLGAADTVSVNTPPGRGVHHLVIDNTDAGEAPARRADPEESVTATPHALGPTAGTAGHATPPRRVRRPA